MMVLLSRRSDQFVQSLHTEDAVIQTAGPPIFREEPAESSHCQMAEQNSDILIFDEPTRGIDVGAKNRNIH